MIQLLRTDFGRLSMNRIFWMFVIISAGTGMFLPLTVLSEVMQEIHSRISFMVAGYPVATFDYYFFTYVIVIAVFSVIFCAYYIGVEHQDGVLRNKIVNGASRNTIYLSYYITNTVAGWIFYTIYMLADVCTGSFALEKFQLFTRKEVIVYIICLYLVLAAFTGISTMIAVMISEPAISVVFCMGILVLLIFLGSHMSASLGNEQYIETDRYIKGVLFPAGSENPFYISGVKRAVYLFLYDFLPGGQVLQFYDLILDTGNRDPAVMICGSAVFSAGSAILGLLLFQRKNLN